MLETTDGNMIEASKLELLIAENFNDIRYVRYKLSAYIRSTEFFLGGVDKNITVFDTYSTLCYLEPDFSNLLLKFSEDDSLPIQLASLNGLRLLISELGCSLSHKIQNILYILCSMKSKNEDIINSKKLLVFELKKVVSSCSSILISNIYHGIVKKMLQPKLMQEIRDLLLYIALRYIQICPGDFQFDPEFTSQLLYLIYEIDSNLALLLWNRLKSKIFPRLTGKNLEEFTKWCCLILATCSDQRQCVIELIYSMILTSQNIDKISADHFLKSMCKLLRIPIRSEDLTEHVRISWKCSFMLARLTDLGKLEPLIKQVLDNIEILAKSTILVSEEHELICFFLDNIPFCKRFADNFSRLLDLFSNSITKNMQDSNFLILEKALRLCKGIINLKFFEILIGKLLKPDIAHSEAYTKLRRLLVHLVVDSFFFKDYLNISLIQYSERLHLDEESAEIQENSNSIVEELNLFIEIITESRDEQALIVLTSWQAIINLCISLLSINKWDYKLRGLEIIRLVLEIKTDSQFQENFMIFCIVDILKTILNTDNDSRMIFLSLKLVYELFHETMPPDHCYPEERAEMALILWKPLECCTSSYYMSISKLAMIIISLCGVTNDPKNYQSINNLLFPFVFSLLSSGEEYKKTNGLRIIAAYCGINEFSNEISKVCCTEVPKHIWRQIIAMSKDSSIKAQEMAQILISVGVNKLKNHGVSEDHNFRKMHSYNQETTKCNIKSLTQIFQQNAPKRLGNDMSAKSSHEISVCKSPSVIENSMSRSSSIARSSKIIKVKLPSEGPGMYLEGPRLLSAPASSKRETNVICKDIGRILISPRKDISSECSLNYSAECEKLLKIPPKLPVQRLEKELSDLLKNLSSPFRKSTKRYNNQDKKSSSLNNSIKIPNSPERDVRVNCS